MEQRKEWKKEEKQKKEQRKKSDGQPENCRLHLQAVVPCIFFLHSLYVSSSFNDDVCDSDCLYMFHSVECLDVNDVEGSDPRLS